MDNDNIEIYSIPTQTLGSFIKRARMSKKMSIRELAEKINATKMSKSVFSAGFLSEIENGRRFPSEVLLLILSKVLGVEVDTLRSFDQRMPSDELKELQAINPQFGFAFRRAVQIIRENGLTPKDMVDRLQAPRNNGDI